MGTREIDNPVAGRKSPETLDYLLRRRTVEAKNLGEPGPSKEQLETILTAAARVPDHGKMFPWHFLVIEGENRTRLGDILRAAYQKDHPDAEPAKLDLEAERFTRAPVIVGVISRIRKGKHPMWEQMLSAGAACQNLILAANASGFAAHWLSEWYAYHEDVRESLGLDGRDNVAGFIYIGTPQKEPKERDRPDLSELVTYWSPAAPVKKGDCYDKEGMGFPEKKFVLPEG